MCLRQAGPPTGLARSIRPATRKRSITRRPRVQAPVGKSASPPRSLDGRTARFPLGRARGGPRRKISSVRYCSASGGGCVTSGSRAARPRRSIAIISGCVSCGTWITGAASTESILSAPREFVERRIDFLPEDRCHLSRCSRHPNATSALRRNRQQPLPYRRDYLRPRGLHIRNRHQPPLKSLALQFRNPRLVPRQALPRRRQTRSRRCSTIPRLIRRGFRALG
jgi:hypothetical protein